MSGRKSGKARRMGSSRKDPRSNRVQRTENEAMGRLGEEDTPSHHMGQEVGGREEEAPPHKSADHQSNLPILSDEGLNESSSSVDFQLSETPGHTSVSVITEFKGPTNYEEPTDSSSNDFLQSQSGPQMEHRSDSDTTALPANPHQSENIKSVENPKPEDICDARGEPKLHSDEGQAKGPLEDTSSQGTTKTQDMSLPVPIITERRRKMGSTRKDTRRAKIQSDREEESNALEQRSGEGEETSLMERVSGSETTVPPADTEIEDYREQRTDQNNEDGKREPDRDEKSLVQQNTLGSQSHQLMDSEKIPEEPVSFNSTEKEPEIEASQSEHDLYTESSTETGEQNMDSTRKSILGQQEERQEEAKEGELETIEEEITKGEDGSAIEEMKEEMLIQDEKSNEIKRDEQAEERNVEESSTFVGSFDTPEITDDSKQAEDSHVVDQLIKSEIGLIREDIPNLTANLDNLQHSNEEIEGPSQKSEEEEMRKEGQRSTVDKNEGDVLFNLTEKRYHEKTEENKERDEEMTTTNPQTSVSSDHLSATLETPLSSTTAGHAEVVNVQDTEVLLEENVHSRSKFEMSPTNGKQKGQTDEMVVEPDVTDTPADTRTDTDIDQAEDTSLPEPNITERRRKMGSTRKGSRRPKRQADRDEGSNAMEQRTGEDEEISLLEEVLDSAAAPPTEIQTEEHVEKRIVHNEEEGKMEGEGDEEGLMFASQSDQLIDSEQFSEEPESFIPTGHLDELQTTQSEHDLYTESNTETGEQNMDSTKKRILGQQEERQEEAKEGELETIEEEITKGEDGSAIEEMKEEMLIQEERSNEFKTDEQGEERNVEESSTFVGSFDTPEITDDSKQAEGSNTVDQLIKSEIGLIREDFPNLTANLDNLQRSNEEIEGPSQKNEEGEMKKEGQRSTVDNNEGDMLFNLTEKSGNEKTEENELREEEMTTENLKTVGSSDHLSATLEKIESSSIAGQLGVVHFQETQLSMEENVHSTCEREINLQKEECQEGLTIEMVVESDGTGKSADTMIVRDSDQTQDSLPEPSRTERRRKMGSTRKGSRRPKRQADRDEGSNATEQERGEDEETSLLEEMLDSEAGAPPTEIQTEEHREESIDHNNEEDEKMGERYEKSLITQHQFASSSDQLMDSEQFSKEPVSFNSTQQLDKIHAEFEISPTNGEQKGQIDEMAVEPDVTDTPADTRTDTDIDQAEDKSLPLPNVTERRRKMGSTRKGSRRPKRQADRDEGSNAMEQERGEDEETSLLEEVLDSAAASPTEMQTEEHVEKRIDHNEEEGKMEAERDEEGLMFASQSDQLIDSEQFSEEPESFIPTAQLGELQTTQSEHDLYTESNTETDEQNMDSTWKSILGQQEESQEEAKEGELETIEEEITKGEDGSAIEEMKEKMLIQDEKSNEFKTDEQAEERNVEESSTFVGSFDTPEITDDSKQAEDSHVVDQLIKSEIGLIREDIPNLTANLDNLQRSNEEIEGPSQKNEEGEMKKEGQRSIVDNNEGDMLFNLTEKSGNEKTEENELREEEMTTENLKTVGSSDHLSATLEKIESSSIAGQLGVVHFQETQLSMEENVHSTCEREINLQKEECQEGLTIEMVVESDGTGRSADTVIVRDSDQTQDSLPEPSRTERRRKMGSTRKGSRRPKRQADRDEGSNAMEQERGEDEETSLLEEVLDSAAASPTEMQTEEHVEKRIDHNEEEGKMEAERDEEGLMFASQSDQLIDSEQFSEEPESFIPTAQLGELQTTQSEHDLYTESNTETDEQNMDSTWKSILGQQEESQEEAKEGELETIEEEITKGEDGSAIEEMKEKMLIQDEKSNEFKTDEQAEERNVEESSTFVGSFDTPEITDDSKQAEDSHVVDQLIKSEIGLIREDIPNLTANLDNLQRSNEEIEGPSQKNEEGEMKKEGQRSIVDNNEGDMLFNLTEKSGNEKTEENELREEEMTTENLKTVGSSDHLSATLEKIESSSIAGQLGVVHFQETQLSMEENVHSTCEREINLQKEECQEGLTIEMVVESDGTGRSADTVIVRDSDQTQDSLPEPSRTERRRKMGSTRKGSRRPKRQADRDEGSNAMEQERGEDEETSLLEEVLDSAAASPTEMQTEEHVEKRIDHNEEEGKMEAERDEEGLMFASQSDQLIDSEQFSEEPESFIPTAQLGELQTTQSEHDLYTESNTETDEQNMDSTWKSILGQQEESQEEAKERELETIEEEITKGEDGSAIEEMKEKMLIQDEKSNEFKTDEQGEERNVEESSTFVGSFDTPEITDDSKQAEDSHVLDQLIKSEIGLIREDIPNLTANLDNLQRSNEEIEGPSQKNEEGEMKKEGQRSIVDNNEGDMLFNLTEKSGNEKTEENELREEEMTTENLKTVGSSDHLSATLEKIESSSIAGQLGVVHFQETQLSMEENVHSTCEREINLQKEECQEGLTIEMVVESDGTGRSADTVIVRDSDQTQDSLPEPSRTERRRKMGSTRKGSRRPNRQADRDESSNAMEQERGEDEKTSLLEEMLDSEAGAPPTEIQTEEHREDSIDHNNEEDEKMGERYEKSLVTQHQFASSSDQLMDSEQFSKEPVSFNSTQQLDEIHAEFEISPTNGDQKGKIDEMAVEPDVTDTPADTRTDTDIDQAEDTSLSEPSRAERRRKMGSTRKGSRRPKRQAYRDEGSNAMEQERGEDEETSLLEEVLDSAAAPPTEMQTEEHVEKRIDHNEEEGKMEGERDEEGLMFASQSDQLIDSEQFSEEPESFIPTEQLGELQATQSEHDLYTESNTETGEQNMDSTKKSILGQQEERQEEAKEGELETIEEEITKGEDGSAIEEMKEKMLIQEEKSNEFKTDEQGEERNVEESSTFVGSFDTPEITDDSKQAEGSNTVDQLIKSEIGLIREDIPNFTANLDNLQPKSEEIEGTSQKSEEGEMRNEGERSTVDNNEGDVLFNLTEKRYHEKTEENKERDEEMTTTNPQTSVSSDHLSATLETPLSSTTAGHAEVVNLQDTELLLEENVHSRSEFEISPTNRDQKRQIDEMAVEPDVTDTPADTRTETDIDQAEDTSLPEPNITERRRKMGSTRKGSRRPKRQADRDEGSNAMEQRTGEDEETSFLEEVLDSAAAPPTEIQTEEHVEKRIVHNEEEGKMEGEGDEEDLMFASQSDQLIDSEQFSEEPESFIPTGHLDELQTTQSEHDLYTESNTETDEQNMDSTKKSILGQQEERQEEAKEGELETIEEEITKGEDGSAIEEMKEEMLIQDEKSNEFKTDEQGEERNVEESSTFVGSFDTPEITDDSKQAEDSHVVDQLIKSEICLIREDIPNLTANLDNLQPNNEEIEGPSQKSEEGEMKKEGQRSTVDNNEGDVLFNLTEKSGNEKTEENELREEEMTTENLKTVGSSDHLSATLEKTESSSIAGQLGMVHFQETQLSMEENVHSTCEREINQQKEECQEGLTNEMVVESDGTDRSADTMIVRDSDQTQDSLPEPSRTERRRKMGSTRKGSRRPKRQADRDEGSNATEQERGEDEETSLLEEMLDSEAGAPPTEIQTEEHREESIDHNNEEDEKMGERYEKSLITQHQFASSSDQLMDSEQFSKEPVSFNSTQQLDEIRAEFEISPTNVDQKGQIDEMAVEPDVTDTPADTRTDKDIDQAEDTYLPEPSRTERRRKMGSTRKGSHRPKRQADRDEGANEMEQERGEDEETSLLKEVLDSEAAALPTEIHEQDLEEKWIDRNKEDGNVEAELHTDPNTDLNQQKTDFTIKSIEEQQGEAQEERKQVELGAQEDENIIVEEGSLTEEPQKEQLRQEEKGVKNEKDERGEEMNLEMPSKDVALDQDISLRTDRRRKLGSTRKGSHRPKRLADRDEDSNVMEQDRGEDEETSLLEEVLDSAAAPPTEMQTEEHVEKRIDHNEEEGKMEGERDEEGLMFASQYDQLIDSEQFSKEPESFIPTAQLGELQTTQSEHDLYTESNTETGEQNMESIVKNTLGQQEERQEEAKEGELETFEEEIKAEDDGSAIEEMLIQDEKTSGNETDEKADQRNVKESSCFVSSSQTPETTDDSKQAEDFTTVDQFIQSEASLAIGNSPELIVSLGSIRPSNEESDGPTQKHEMEEMRHKEERSIVENNEGEVLFHLIEKSDHEKTAENEEREQEITTTNLQTENSFGNLSATSEESKSCPTAEQPEMIYLQETEVHLEENVHFRCQGETGQTEGGKRGLTDGMVVESDGTDRSADTMIVTDSDQTQDSLPEPSKTERRRKMGSTRKGSRRPTRQADRDEGSNAMEQERGEDEETSLLKEVLDSEAAALPTEIHEQDLEEKWIDRNKEDGKVEAELHTDPNTDLNQQKTDFTIKSIEEQQGEAQEERKQVELRAQEDENIIVEEGSLTEEPQKEQLRQEEKGVKNEKDERGEEMNLEMPSKDVALDQDISLRTDRRRKLGSTRKGSHRPKRLADRDEDSNVMEQDRGEGEDTSLAEQQLGSEAAVPSAEIQTGEHSEKKTDHGEEDGRMEAKFHTEPYTDSKTDFTIKSPCGPNGEAHGETKERESGAQDGGITEEEMRSSNEEMKEKMRIQEDDKEMKEKDQREEEGYMEKAFKDFTLPQDMSLPVSNRPGRRRKMGSTRKSSRKPEMQSDRDEETSVMDHERKDEESALLEESLGSETNVVLTEIKIEEHREKKIYDSKDGEKIEAMSGEKNLITQHQFGSQFDQLMDSEISSPEPGGCKSTGQLPELQASQKEHNLNTDSKKREGLNTAVQEVELGTTAVELRNEEERSTAEMIEEDVLRLSVPNRPARRRKMGSTRKGSRRPEMQADSDEDWDFEGQRGQGGGTSLLDEVMGSLTSAPSTERQTEEPRVKRETPGLQEATQTPPVKRKLGSRRKGGSSKWREERDQRQTDEEDPKITAVMKRIQEVFSRCDIEEKGFITWEEMQGLGGELNLSVAELQQVFDRLDVDKDGHVTPQDFTTSFREFIQLQQPKTQPVTFVYQSQASIVPEGVEDNERKHFVSMLDDLSAYNLLQDQSEIWRLWVELRNNEPHLLNNLEDFVAKVTEQIKTVQQERDCLEMALQRRIQQHNIGVQELYEEMERQISREKEKVKNESLMKSRSQLAEMEEALDKKNREVQGLITVQNELEGTLQELRRQKLQTSEKNQELSRTNQELEGQLERIRGQLQETLSHVQAMRSSVTHRQSLPQIQGPPSASERIEKSGEISGPQVLNLDFAAESQKTEAHEAVSHGDVVFERSGSVLGDYIQQDSFTGLTGVKGDASKGRLISIEEDPLPDLVNTSQSAPQWHQGEAMWDKQRAMQRGDRGSQSTLSRSPSAPDVLYNVVLVGNSAVGKTSFMRRFQSGEFCTDHCATIGLDSCIQTLHIDGTRVILQLWDTAGQERYHSITKQILRKAQGLLLMYDITSSSSFLDVRYWLSSIQEGASDDVIILLLGSKNDSSKREVSYQDGETLAREYSIRFMECSAATGDNVSLSMNILARMLKQQVDEKQEGNFMLHKMPPKKKSGCC